MVESTPYRSSYQSTRRMVNVFFKVKVLKDHKADGANEMIKESLAKQSIIFIDKSILYANIADFEKIFISKNQIKILVRKP